MEFLIFRYLFLFTLLISYPKSNQIEKNQLFTLRSASGKMMINTEPEGAKIDLNGIYQGKSPMRIKNLEIGAHNLTLFYPGYEKVDKIIILKDSTVVNIDEYLLAKTGNLRVLSEPIGAKVFIDNAFINYTPMDLPELLVKKYYLRLELDSYESVYDEIDIKENSRVTKSYTLESKLGAIRIYMRPEGIKLKINKKNFLENSPEIINLDLKEGRYELEFIKPGYLSLKRDISIKPGENQSMKILLKKTPIGIPKSIGYGLLNVSSKDEGVKLKIKGIKGEFDLPLDYYDLEEGDYKIVLYAKGKQKEVHDIKIERQRTTIIKANLKPKKRILDYLFD